VKTPAPGERGVVIVEIFRIRDRKIVEHWDVIQHVPEKAMNRNSMSRKSRLQHNKKGGSEV
jgi:predicted SnoaL-like aldol condensation-catalyzing enzyme